MNKKQIYKLYTVITNQKINSDELNRTDLQNSLQCATYANQHVFSAKRSCIISVLNYTHIKSIFKERITITESTKSVYNICVRK